MSILFKHILLTLLGIACASSVQAMDLNQGIIDVGPDDNIQRVQELINAGANVNAQDRRGNTALMKAAIWGHEDIAELLLKHGAHVNARDSLGRTALMKAAAWGNEDIAELLLKHGVNINAQDSDGWTALMEAAVNNHKEIVELLLKHNADITIKDEKGRTALDLARERFGGGFISQEKKAEYKEIGRMLLEAYIKQKKLKGEQAAAAREMEAGHPGVPPQAISRYFTP